MNLFAKAVSLLTFFKSPSRGYHSFSEKECLEALQNCLQWFENISDDNGLPASSYSLLLDQCGGPSARTTAHWLDVMVLLSSADISDLYLKQSVQQHANTLAEWLVSIQRKDGTWPVGSNDYKNRPPSVFQTGVIICALIAYSEKFGTKLNIAAAIEKGVQWLLKTQQENGSWDEYVFGKHLICTNAGAALIRSGIYLNDANILNHGKRSIDFYFSFQIGNGFFFYLPTGQKDYFSSDYGFILNGFSKAALLLNHQPYAEKVWYAARPVIQSGKGQGLIPGIINSDFNAPVNYHSLYGSVMLLLTTLRIYSLLHNEEVFYHSRLLGLQIASAQLKSENKFIHGGFPVSQPSSGGYKPYEISGDAIALFSKALLLMIHQFKKTENTSYKETTVN